MSDRELLAILMQLSNEELNEVERFIDKLAAGEKVNKRKEKGA